MKKNLIKITNLHDIFDNLTDFNIYYDEEGEAEPFEFCDDIFDLFEEIQLTLYNKDKLEDYQNENYLKQLNTDFIILSNSERFTFDKFVPLIIETNNEWRMIGDEDFIN